MYEPLTKIDQVILPPEQKEDILTSINVFSAYRTHRRKMDKALSDDRQLVTGLVLMLCGPPGTGKTVSCVLS
jgi:flagellar biosynthesis GTPase FlhF